VFQRIGRIFPVTFIRRCRDSSDAAHFIVWKRDGILGAYVPRRSQVYPAEHRDVDVSSRLPLWLSIIAYTPIW